MALRRDDFRCSTGAHGRAGPRAECAVLDGTRKLLSPRTATRGISPAPRATERFNAGFSRISVPALENARPLRGGVWYPTGAREVDRLCEGARFRVAVDALPGHESSPLVVVSAPGGESFASLHRLGEALARRGFVVAGVDHPGDNDRDLSGTLGQAQLVDRPRDLARAIDAVCRTEKYVSLVGAHRVGAIGVGVGANSVLQLAGAPASVTRLRRHLERERSESRRLPHFERLLARVNQPCPAEALPGLAAIVLLEPTLLPAFSAAALGSVVVPAMVCHRSGIPASPFGFNAGHALRHLGGATRYAWLGRETGLDTLADGLASFLDANLRRV